jgi:uncharacterized protein (TIGR02145 family)
MINQLDANSDGGNFYNNIAGRKMKSIGTQYWLYPSLASNESGFSGFSGGYFDSFQFGSIPNDGAYWWSITSYGLNNAWYRTLHDFDESAERSSYFNKSYGFSLRCLRD